MAPPNTYDQPFYRKKNQRPKVTLYFRKKSHIIYRLCRIYTETNLS